VALFKESWSMSPVLDGLLAFLGRPAFFDLEVEFDPEFVGALLRPLAFLQRVAALNEFNGQPSALSWRTRSLETPQCFARALWVIGMGWVLPPQEPCQGASLFNFMAAQEKKTLMLSTPPG
jgi:hypothetical protein